MAQHRTIQAKFALCVLLAGFGISPKAFALEPVQTFTLDGQLFTNPTSTDPLLDPSVVLNIKILDSTKSCIIYEENQNVNTLGRNGFFNIQVGSEIGSLKRAMTDPGNSMAAIFQNNLPVNASNTGCVAGASPVANGGRFLKITAAPSTTGQIEEFSEMAMDAVPNAVVAESLQGLSPINILQTGPQALTQANLQNVFTTSNHNALLALLNGSSSQYMSRNSNGAQLPSIAGNAPAPAVGQMWFDSVAGVMKYRDGTGIQIVGSASGAVSSIATGAGLTGGPITSTGTISLADGGVTAIKVDPAINLVTSGSVTAQTVTAVGVLNSASSHSREIQLFMPGTGLSKITMTAPALAADYSLIWPMTAGSAGQVLTTDGSGTLNWSSPTGLTQWTTNGANIFYGTGNVGIGTSVPGAALDVIGRGSFAQLSGGIGTPLQVQNTHTGLVQDLGVGVDLRIQGIPTGMMASAWSANGSNANSHLSFLTRGNSAMSERMRISANGNVGIGTTTPAALLDLVGITTSNSAIILPRAALADRPVGVNGMIRYNTDSQKFEAFGNSAWAEFATSASGGGASQWTTSGANIYYGSGNVGIGTSSPAATLDVNGTIRASGSSNYTNISFGAGGHASSASNTQAVLSAGSSLVGGNWRTGSNTIASLIELSTGTIAFSTNTGLATGSVFTPTTRMTIDGSGNVGIGTTAPAFPLEVIGNFRSSSSVSALGAILSGNGTATSPAHSFVLNATSGMFYPGSGGLALATSSVERVRIDGSGNVGIGTTAPAALLDLVGTTTANSAILVPRADLAARPTGVNGMIRYNTDTDKFEGYQANAWTNLVGGTASSLPVNGLTAATAANAINHGNFQQGWDWNSLSSGSGLRLATTSMTSGTLLDLWNYNGASSTGAVAKITVDSVSSNSTPLMLVNAGSGASFRVNDDGTATDTTPFIIDNAGNVGIGTSSPSANLNVVGSATIDLGLSGLLRLRQDGANPSGMFASKYGEVSFSTNAYWDGFWKYDRAYQHATSIEHKSGDIYLKVAPNSGNINTMVSWINGLTVSNSGRVGVGTDTPIVGAALDVTGTSTGNSALIVPRSTTALRPSAPVNGMIRYNTDLFAMEIYGSGAWSSLGLASGGSGSSQWITSGSNIYYGSGNVGIGTSAPNYQMDIYTTGSVNRINQVATTGSSSHVLTSGNGNTSYLTLQSNGSGGGISGNGDFVATMNFAGNDGAGNKNAATIRADIDAVPAAGSMPGRLVFLTTPAASVTPLERMRITNAGAVGIGTTSTAAGTLLDVAGAIQSQGSSGSISTPLTVLNPNTSAVVDKGTSLRLRVGSNIDIGSIAAATSTTSATDSYLAFSNRTAGAVTEKMRIDNNGNVGIGTTAPVYKLQVESSPVATSGSQSNANAVTYPRPLSASSATYTGMTGEVYLQSGSSNVTGSINALAAWAQNNSTSGVTNAKGNYTGVYNNAAGTITNAYANQMEVTNAAAGSITNAYGNYVGVTRSAGTITNAYGYYSGTIQGTNKYSFYAADATAPNYFAGNTGIGTTSPAAALDVVGTTTGNSAIIVPRSTTALRPSAPVNGMIRYNTDLFAMEIYGSGAWSSIGAGGGGGGNQWTTSGSDALFALTGNVGIGTTVPSSTLDVAGTTTTQSLREGAAAFVNSTASYTIPDTTLSLRRITLTNDATITLPSPSNSANQIYTLTVMVKQDGSGNHLVSFAPGASQSILWDRAATTPPAQTAAGAITIYQFTRPLDETIWYASMVWKQN